VYAYVHGWALGHMEGAWLSLAMEARGRHSNIKGPDVVRGDVYMYRCGERVSACYSTRLLGLAADLSTVCPLFPHQTLGHARSQDCSKYSARAVDHQ
jgi:hypothetical protein